MRLLLPRYNRKQSLPAKCWSVFRAEAFDWKPHERSMSMKRLSVLVEDMFG